MKLWWLTLTSTLVISIHRGKATCLKGKVPSEILTGIEDVLREAAIIKGHIHQSGNARYGFSGNIPDELHQVIRNLLSSY